MSADGRLRRCAAVEARPLIARILDMVNDSDTDTVEERCIIEQQERAPLLPHTKHLHVQECTPQ